LLYPRKQPSRDWLESLSREVSVNGGHVMGNLWQDPPCLPAESDWIRMLEERWGSL
jgi:hypothetical protein